MGRNDTGERPWLLPAGSALLVTIIVLMGRAGGVEVKPIDLEKSPALEEFTAALDQSDDEAALSASQPIFAALRQKYASDAGFRAFESRLTAAEFLGTQMRQQLTRAGEARTIFEKYPRHASAGQAIWLYYYALSRNNSAREILADIDQALADERCRRYEPKLMYIKWWALRRQRNQAARVAAMEYDLLQRYADDPMVAPILLSRATDMLASQSYREACETLQQLIQKFPTTQAAAQARRMLDKVKSTQQKK